MKEMSKLFKVQQWQDWHGVNQSVPSELQRVAKAFIELQDERHSADYDNHEQWTITEVRDILNMARAAFDEWLVVKSDPIAGNYVLSVLIGPQRK